MTQDEIIEMAREVYGTTATEQEIRFAHLVAAKATEEANAKANASWELMCKKMVAFEREACAEVADEYANQVFEHNFSKLIAHNIRARGEQA